MLKSEDQSIKVTEYPQILLKQNASKLDWLTPKSLQYELEKEFHFVLDAATCKHNPLRISAFYTERDNGLYQPWYNPTYVNPPYGRERINAWIQKARLEQTNGVTSVFLLPSKTGTRWFHRFIYNKPNIEIRFLHGRLRFTYCTECYPQYMINGNKWKKVNDDKWKDINTAPFDSMIITFRATLV